MRQVGLGWCDLGPCQTLLRLSLDPWTESYFLRRGQVNRKSLPVDLSL